MAVTNNAFEIAGPINLTARCIWFVLVVIRRDPSIYSYAAIGFQ
jgi:hypothetical protein